MERGLVQIGKVSFRRGTVAAASRRRPCLLRDVAERGERGFAKMGKVSFRRGPAAAAAGPCSQGGDGPLRPVAVEDLQPEVARGEIGLDLHQRGGGGLTEN